MSSNQTKTSSNQNRYSKALVWLRRDLRTYDHVALSEATHRSRESAVVFVFDTQILKKLKNDSDTRVQFIYDSVMEIDQELKKRGSKLILLSGDPIELIPELAKSLKVDAIFFNEDYTPYAKKRDATVIRKLKDQSIETEVFKDHVVFNGKEVLKKDQSPYTVFTPYKKAWLGLLQQEDYQEHTVQSKWMPSGSIPKKWLKFSHKDLGFRETQLHFKPGQNEAKKSLKNFSDEMKNYHENRNFPEDEHGTSRLSPHLRFGTISTRHCVREALSQNTKGAQTWLSEIIWREFYQMIIDHFPYSAKSSFKPKYDQIKWPGKLSHFKAWCDGMTGYPIVDAGMRQLNSIGWMHNRVRMITASFLIKDLLIDWRKGERYFAEKLLDYELGSNVGGWQWSASTGCDAAPYFRIFNPITQSEKFDPEGHYIKKWVPELEPFSSKYVHAPWEADQYPLGFNLGKTYPKPLVDHKEQRKKALKLYDL